MIIVSMNLCSKQKSKDAIFYSYKRHINGFAAILDEKEAAEIASAMFQFFPFNDIQLVMLSF